jgi:hypothetical protein
LISGTAIAACSDDDFVSSTQAAVDRWNGALGRTVFQHYCNYPQVWVSTANFNDPVLGCPSWAHACTRPTDVSGEEILNPTYVQMNPDLFPGEEEWADGGAHTSRDVTHEFGHVLGHADYDFGQYGSCQFETIMDTWERCWDAHDPRIETPQAQDVTNYNDAYKPNGVSNLAGSCPSPGRVQLSWNPSNVHAEALFHIRRWPTGQGCCGTWAADAGKNSSGILLSDQPSGSQQYAVWGYTHALNDPFGDGPSPGDVTVTVCATGDSDADSKGVGGPCCFLFRDDAELFMGTDPYDNCADTATPNNERGPEYGEPLSPWPPDFNDNGRTDIGDLVALKNHWVPLGNPYGPRYDLNANGICDIGDLVVLKLYWVGSGRDTCTVG